MKNNSDLKVMWKEAGILFAITLLAGILLGFIHELTKEPIRIQQEKAIREACQAVFVGAQEFKELEYVPDAELTESLGSMGVKAGKVYEACDTAGACMGYVVESTSTEGYGGNITLYMGVTLDGMINDIALMEISETAGLGMQADNVLSPQFHEKKVESFTYTKSGSRMDSEIDAISGATITTKAVTNAVNGGLLIFGDLKEGGGSNE